jgi:hypothetical protein
MTFAKSRFFYAHYNTLRGLHPCQCNLLITSRRLQVSERHTAAADS